MSLSAKDEERRTSLSMKPGNKMHRVRCEGLGLGLTHRAPRKLWAGAPTGLGHYGRPWRPCLQEACACARST